MGMTGLTPQMKQQLMAYIAAQSGANRQGGAPQPGQMPQGQPGQQPPQATGGSGQPSQLGGNNMTMPGGTVSPMIPGVQMSATPPKQAGSVSARGLAALPGAVMAVKQSMQRSKTEKARQLAGQYLAMKNSQDPKVQQAADQLLSDPKNHKIFDKATSDPSSAEYAGVQMAYRDMVGQEQQAQKMQEMQQKVQSMQAMASQRDALAQREHAQATDIQKQTEQRGTVTEKDAAANKIKEDQIQARGEQATAQIKMHLQQTDMTTKAMLEAVNKRVAGSIKVANIHESGAKGRQNSRIDTYIQGEYKSLQGQLNALDKQSKDLTSHMDKESTGVKAWFVDPEDKSAVQQQLAQIEAQRGVLTQQFQMLQQKDKAFQSTGLTPQPASSMQGDGSEQKPYVIK